MRFAGVTGALLVLAVAASLRPADPCRPRRRRANAAGSLRGSEPEVGSSAVRECCCLPQGASCGSGAVMRRVLVCVVVVVAVFSHLPQCLVAAPQSPARDIEVAVVANAEAATVAFVDVESRAILGVIDVNPARTKAEGPGKPNYAQDTDVSPGWPTLYVSRGYRRRRGVRHRDRPAAVAAVAGHRPRRPHDADAGRTQPVRLGDARQPRLQDRDGDGRDRRASRDRRLSARRQGVEGRPPVVQHQPRAARRHAAVRRRTAADRDARLSVPVDHRRRRYAGDPRSDPPRNGVPAVAVQRRTSGSSTRNCRTSTSSSATTWRRGRWTVASNCR